MGNWGRFRCHQCGIHTDSIRCPGCNLYLSDNQKLVEQFLDYPNLPPKGRVWNWGTAFTNWGDSLVSLAVLEWTLDQLGRKDCKVLYVGRDPNIPRMFEAQEWCSEAVQLYGDWYPKVQRMAVHSDVPAATWIGEISSSQGKRGVQGGQDQNLVPDPRTAWPTHLTDEGVAKWKIPVPKKVLLPPESVRWAKRALEENPLQDRKSYRRFLLHPISVWSSPFHQHWSHWKEALEYLSERTDTGVQFILTGLEDVPGFKPGPQFVDLIRKTPSQLEVFALVQECDGVISTCNSVSIWSQFNGIPSVVSGNVDAGGLTNVFRRVIDRPPVRFLDVNTPLEVWRESVDFLIESPREFGIKLQKEFDREVVEVISEREPDLRRFEVVLGIVSGIERDYPTGSVVRGEDLNGPAEEYLLQGMIREVDSNGQRKSESVHRRDRNSPRVKSVLQAR